MPPSAVATHVHVACASCQTRLSGPRGLAGTLLSGAIQNLHSIMPPPSALTAQTQSAANSATIANRGATPGSTKAPALPLPAKSSLLPGSSATPGSVAVAGSAAAIVSAAAARSSLSRSISQPPSVQPPATVSLAAVGAIPELGSDPELQLRQLSSLSAAAAVTNSSSSVAAAGAGAGRHPVLKQPQRHRYTLCPNEQCKQPLPVCSVCTMAIGHPVGPHLQLEMDLDLPITERAQPAQPDDSDYSLYPTDPTYPREATATGDTGDTGPTDQQDTVRSLGSLGSLRRAVPSLLSATSWCASCRHGGHAAHMAAWFRTRTVCPVPGCRCACFALDANI